MNQKRFSLDQAYVGCMISEVAMPNLIKIYQVGGVQFVIIDCEHGAFTFSELSAMVAVGNAIGVTVLVRIPEASREWVLKPLELGANGLILPMANTAEMMARVVQYGKYRPLGNRGLAKTRPHCQYQMEDVSAYIQKANQKTVILAQIETWQAVKNCPEILAVDGVDGVLVGPNDLSMDLNVPGQVTAPEVLAGIEQAFTCAKAAGKLSGIITGNKDLIKRYRQDMQLFSIGSETSMLLHQLCKTCTDFSG